MAAKSSIVSGACAQALRALSEGLWAQWKGLPPDCALAEISHAFGGASMLDATVYLGHDRVPCSRSSLEDVPATIWHDGDQVLLVEFDMVSRPRPAPRLGGVARHHLDLPPHYAAASELVFPSLGLSLLLTSRRKIVGCRGFSAMSAEDYVARRRPDGRALRPHLRPAPFSPRTGHKGAAQ
ncbi:hypothetical protein [Mesorhizobium sp. 1B3]|uniref:hypothetical protein n=1 Tax=Mesorhizobium sp. 1B3 TaxID=3243599 RepID=UPI003D97EF98